MQQVDDTYVTVTAKQDKYTWSLNVNRNERTIENNYSATLLPFFRFFTVFRTRLELFITVSLYIRQLERD